MGAMLWIVEIAKKIIWDLFEICQKMSAKAPLKVYQK
jgi:hypothetical protein